LSCGIARLGHEALGDAKTVPRPINIEALELERMVVADGGRHDLARYGGVGNQFIPVLGDEDESTRAFDLGAQLSGRERGLDVHGHVLLRVVRRVGVAKGLGAERREGVGVARNRVSDSWSIRLHGMEILEQSPRLVVCHQSATYMRGFGLAFAGLGAGALVLVTHANRANVHGSPWVAYVVGIAFVIAGLGLFAFAEDDRIVLDGAAHVARIIRRGLWRKSMTEVPFAKIRDVALEMSVMNTRGSSNGGQPTFRPVFVCADNSRVPWTPVLTSDRITQAKAVAAARAIGGWNALPTEGSPAMARAVTAVKNLGCLYGFAVVFIGFLLLIMGTQVAPLATWVPTSATVTSSSIAWDPGQGHRTYRPFVTYRYSVAGTTYTSQRFAPLQESASQQWAQSLVDRYPTGAEVTVWYDPKH